MANAQTEHSKKLRAKTAAAHNKAKLASGERKTLSLNGKAEEIDTINAAIAKAGGSKVKALSAICAFYLENA
ncbi:hypothetical protein [Bergeriella denitrificans]|uniref:Phage associated protein n=1 Tax=Bergeriella denitrificans TaxID=494 RepID=A0A378UKM4_BERDE|nr:hypothetical protein [Bergeriella denitrificans]STZ77199.1 phage associated protein [Bergeriella denitrificans]